MSDKLSCPHCEYTVTEDEWDQEHPNPDEGTDYICPQCNEHLDFDDLEDPEDPDEEVEA